MATLVAMMRDIAPFGLRIPSELKARIEHSANERKRSLNSEMIARLTESFSASKLPDFTDGELIAELMRRYARGDIYIRIGNLKCEIDNK